MKILLLLFLFTHIYGFVIRPFSHRVPLKLFESSAADNDDDQVALVPSVDFLSNELDLTFRQASQLTLLANLVMEWNDKINLVSRKDCTIQTVWERHIVPSLAVYKLERLSNETVKTVVDVGTGGGFPGLPLAILYPDIQFTLLDSVGKKLAAVQDMADQLGLTNVKTHHGRAETLEGVKFDIATGRSVSSLKQFSAWMHHLLSGQLLYWIGGDVPEAALAVDDTPIQELLPIESDKRILTFEASAVKQMALESGIKVTRQKQQEPKRAKKVARGAWQRKEVKQRGYEDFQRYSST